MSHELEIDFSKLCDGNYELSLDETFWSKIKNKHEELVLAKKAFLCIGDNRHAISSLSLENLLTELNNIFSKYCKDGDNQIRQKTVSVEFSHLIPLKMTLKPKKRKKRKK